MVASSGHLRIRFLCRCPHHRQEKSSEKLSTPTRRFFTPPNLHGFLHVITSLNYNTLASPNLHRKFTRIFLHRLEPFYAANLRRKITPQHYVRIHR